RISEADRKAIMEISGEALAAEIGKAVAAGEHEALEKLRAQGVVVEIMPEEMFELVVEALEPTEQAWFAKAKKAGLENPEQVLADFRAELSAASSETTE